MGNRVFEYVTTEKIDFRIPLEDAFYFKPKGRFIWLKSLAWRFLGRSKSLQQAHTYNTEYKRSTIDTEDFMKKLFAQRSDLLNNYMKRPGKLLIGHKTFEELMGSEYGRTLMPFNATWYHAKNGRTKIMKMEVVLIPWMKGMCVMPDEV